MKVYNHYPRDSRGVGRTARMMERYAPTRMEFVDAEKDAQLILLHVVGRRDHVRRTVEHTIGSHQRVAIIQHVLRSCQKPNAKEWEAIWAQCELIWSAYNLPLLSAQDGARFTTPFYHAPFGCDPDVFRAPLGNSRRYVLGTASTSPEVESIHECYTAAKHTGRLQMHLGNSLQPEDNIIEVFNNISDGELAQLWGQCEYVSGLRQIEGFELPAVEGLLCGARPILYDAPHYRQWYGPWGVFIPTYHTYLERMEAITNVLKEPVLPVSYPERNEAAQFFHWQRIINGFWERIDD